MSRRFIYYNSGTLSASYLVDIYSLPIAYSFYKRSSTAVNCVTIRRESPNAEETFGFVDGYVDVSGIETFLGASAGRITRIYNQGLLGGGDVDMRQTNTSLQPFITITNGVADIDYSGGDLYFQTNLLGASILDKNSTSFCYFTSQSASETRAGVFEEFENTDANNRIALFSDTRAANKVFHVYLPDATASITEYINALTINEKVIATYRRTINEVESYKNGILQDSITSAETFPSNDTRLTWGRQTVNLSFEGQSSEILIADSSLSNTDREAIETILINDYGI